MPTVRDSQATQTGLFLLLSAIPLAAAGIYITFSVNHAPFIGLVAVIVITLGASITRTVGLAVVPETTRAWKASNAVAAAASIVVSVLAGAALVVGPTLGALTLLVAAWAAVMAVCDILLSLNASLSMVRRDFRVLALAGVALALTEGILPLSSVYAVGILGAYAIVTSVYLGIAGTTLRFDATSAPKEGKPTA